MIEISTVGQSLPPIPPVMQFPREQWLIRPQRRIISLLIVDRMLDHWDDLPPARKAEVTFLFTYGGRERIA